MGNTADIYRALVQGVVEGITEFLPISSTGHMRLVREVMGPVVSPGFNSTFDIFIQVGAIAAVLVYFRHKLMHLVGFEAHSSLVLAGEQLTPGQRKHTLMLILLGTLPLGVGYLAAKQADKFYETHARTETLVIAAALGIGGVVMLLIERFKPRATTTRLEAISYRQAVIIGCAQIIAGVFPGTSRSMATIMPALCMRISRPAAAEFSFFLAIPALMAAAGIKLVKFLRSPGAHGFEYMLLGVGTVTAFIVAYVVIAGFMSFIRRYSFTPFAIYRILLAIAVFVIVRG